MPDWRRELGPRGFDDERRWVSPAFFSVFSRTISFSESARPRSGRSDEFCAEIGAPSLVGEVVELER